VSNGVDVTIENNDHNSTWENLFSKFPLLFNNDSFLFYN